VRHFHGTLVARISTLLPITALLLATCLLILSIGLLNTLLGVRAELEGMSRASIGLFMSSYFFGYVVGAHFCTRFIETVGQIRTFAAMASLASAIALCHLLFVSPLAWTLLRVGYGFCQAGMVVIVESWINLVTDKAHRGRVLAVYNLIALGSAGMGQFLLTLSPPAGFVLFCLVSILLSLSLLPIVMAPITNPTTSAVNPMNLLKVFRISPIAAAGVLVAGMSWGGFLGLGPSFALGIGLDERGVARFMAAAYVGALLLQWPLGWLSDRVDRRLVILLNTLGTLVISLAIVLALNSHHGPIFTLFSFFFGTMGLTLYSVCIATVNDHLTREEIIPATSSLILIFAMGAVLGPVAAGLFMNLTGEPGLFLYLAALEGGYLLFALYRYRQRPPMPEASKDQFVAFPRTSPTAACLDRRADGSDQECE
jgi:MFS family permease